MWYEEWVWKPSEQGKGTSSTVCFHQPIMVLVHFFNPLVTQRSWTNLCKKIPVRSIFISVVARQCSTSIPSHPSRQTPSVLQSRLDVPGMHTILEHVQPARWGLSSEETSLAPPRKAEVAEVELSNRYSCVENLRVNWRGVVDPGRY